MSSTIILNSTHATSTGRFEYIFPSAVKFGADDEIALQSMSIYNSVFNVEAQRGNNKITVTFNALVPETADFVLDDGFYDVNAINSFIQHQCIARKWYMLNGDAAESTTKGVYFLDLLTNPSVYGVQLNTYVLPTEANAAALGYTKPEGATWDFPIADQTMQVEILTASFGNLIGFKTGTYPATIQSTDQNILSVKTPQISPVNSIILACNLINSPYSVPNSIFYSLPINTSFGGMINHASSSPIYNKIAAGGYSRIVVDMLDQHFSNLRIHDTELVLVLSLRAKQK